MPHNPIRFDLLRRAFNRLAQMSPIHAQVWVVVDGDGYSNPYSYAFSYSWIGALADTGRETFRDFQSRNSGNIAMKNMVILLPYIAGKPTPTRGQQLILYTPSGALYARMWVNFVQPRAAETPGSSTNGVYAYEIHAERQEG